MYKYVVLTFFLYNNRNPPVYYVKIFVLVFIFRNDQKSILLCINMYFNIF